MEITKQDLLILLQGGGILETIISVTPYEKQKILEKSSYPRLIRIKGRYLPVDTKIGFNQNVMFEANIFFKSEIEDDGYIIRFYEFLLHPNDELWVKGISELEIAVFTLPQYILEAPSIKQVEIQNTFNLPNFNLEGNK